ncbi:MAG: peptide chain release factor-like protein [Verrucomicrobia bacterium]|nr:peptide chain release factor-like protein [Verrucomicrobiota bacterium]MDA1086981.1 peptide chain release factor-like protein [Verrucomicrobiota bacterium]
MSEAPISSAKWRSLRTRMVRLEIREEDLVEKFVLGSGSGGQKVNKTASCVSLRHAESGLSVKVQRSRSRESNRYFARRDLCDKLAEKLLGEKTARRQAQEKIRRQKRRRSRRAKAQMLDEKRKQGEKKTRRKRVDAQE